MIDWSLVYGPWLLLEGAMTFICGLVCVRYREMSPKIPAAVFLIIIGPATLGDLIVGNMGLSGLAIWTTHTLELVVGHTILASLMLVGYIGGVRWILKGYRYPPKESGA